MGLADLYRQPEWQDRAACRGMDIDIFFPAKGKGLKQARGICAGCSVRQECLDEAIYVMQSDDSDGFRGGKTYRQRRMMRNDLKLGVKHRCAARDCRLPIVPEEKWCLDHKPTDGITTMPKGRVNDPVARKMTARGHKAP